MDDKLVIENLHNSKINSFNYFSILVLCIFIFYALFLQTKNKPLLFHVVILISIDNYLIIIQS